jgi:HEXXH motif-containing protein
MEGLANCSVEAFLPTKDRAAFLDDRMHDELASSLTHLSSALSEIDIVLSKDLFLFSKELENKRKVRSIVFRQYYQLVLLIFSQNFDAARLKLCAMRSTAPRQASSLITYFGHPSSDEICYDLISEGMRIAPLESAAARQFTSIIHAGFELMQDTLPDLYDEITQIIHEIILVHEPNSEEQEFHGASHYQFWGLLLLNPKHHKSPLEVVEVLAHEAAHSLLFGLTIHEPLVLNPDTDLFPSPLRADLRPMDGIFHATYVSARMCWAMETIAASGKLSEIDGQKALDAAKIDRKNYLEGLAVILDHAELSESGERILASARQWMER